MKSLILYIFLTMLAVSSVIGQKECADTTEYELGRAEALDMLVSGAEIIYIFPDHNELLQMLGHMSHYVVFDSLLAIDGAYHDSRMLPLRDFEICHYRGFRSIMDMAIRKRFPRNYIKKQIRRSRKIVMKKGY